ncbi:ABC protein, sub ABCG [Dermatophagoides farinae]|uniref:ABC protein, sub ABCG n=1 Tax=Dermatophagoides farinae TaxID=6954 RepID=A0A922KWR4_DERFA|nr:ABC protein, sub ABCG [Dermatophagoides farinae]
MSSTEEIEIENFDDDHSQSMKNVSILWRNLRFEVNNSRYNCWFNKPKIILQRLNGHLYRKSLNGFLGPSGSGKTTLLNCLNGTLQSGVSADSEIYIRRNDKIPVIRIIEQHIQETIIGKMTIRQILEYAFRFKNNRDDNRIMNEHIGQVLKELILDETILNKQFEHCSGGEQRRVAIAQELMSLQQPDFLFLDEPTTGLDSNSALLVMQCLRRLVDHNDHLTILVSIHVPSSDILNLFDKLYILAKGGVCIYFDDAKNLQGKLQQTTQQELEADKPPIEEYSKIACKGIGDELVRRFANSCLQEQIATINSTTKIINQQEFYSIDQIISKNQKKFSLYDLWLQFNRLLLIVFVVERTKLFLLLISLALFITVLSTMYDPLMVTPNTCYSFDNNDDGADIGNITCMQKHSNENYIFQYRIFLTNIIWISGATTISISAISFIQMMKIFINEHRNKWYSLVAFYLSFNLVRLFEFTLVAIFLTIFNYFTVNHLYIDQYRIDWQRFGYYVYFTWLIIIYTQSCGFLLGIIFTRYLEIAVILGLIVSQTFHIFIGFIFKSEQLNDPVWQTVMKIVKNRYIYNGFLYSFYSFHRCDPETERSYILVDNDIDQDQIFSESSGVFLNILIIRLITALILWWKFSFYYKRGKKQLPQTTTNDELLPIDYDENAKMENIDLTRINRTKIGKEIEFENFTRNKIMIAWRSINLFASSSIYEMRSANNIDQGSKLILKNLNGHFRFGSLNALMGPSGAGKTSLLKVLNGQMKTRLSEESEFYLTKYCPTRVCYLTQEVSGHLMPGLTALQSLIYASRLKNSSEESNLNHESIARNMLNELGIADIADTYVQKCSGGERKRLALGLELTSQRMPNLICIDEPTSGLDSNSAEVVVAYLAKLARAHNLTIIASIHQPNIQVLMMFDQLYVLAKGGVCVYSGPPSNIRQFLMQIPDINETRIMEENNLFPIEQLIRYSCLNYTDPIVEKLAQHATAMEITNQQNKMESMQDTQKVIDGIPTNRIRFSLRSCWILLLRYMAYIRGHKWISFTAFIILIIIQGPSLVMKINTNIALTSGCVNWEESYNNTCNRTEVERQKDDDLEQNFMYIISANTFFVSLIFLQCTILLLSELRYFSNEHRNGWYSSGTFYLTRMVIEWIPLLITTIGFVYTINIYEIVRPGIFYWYTLLFILAVIPMQSIGYLLVIVAANSFAVIIVTMSVISIIWFLLSDGNAPIDDLHYSYQILSNFVPLRFLNRGTLILQYGFDRCRSKEIQAILYRYHIVDDDLNHSILMLIMNVLLFQTLALLALIVKVNPFQSRRNRAEKILNHHQTLRPLNVIIPGLGCHHEFTIKQFAI